MAEQQQRKAPDRLVAERYYAECVHLPATESSAQAALQETINKKAKRRWQLISVTQKPSSQSLFLVWDTEGHFSG